MSNHPATIRVKARHKKTGEVMSFPSINTCAKALGATQGNVTVARDKPNRTVCGWYIETA